MAAAIGAVAGVDRDALGAAYDRYSDLGLAIEDVLARAGHAPDPATSPTLGEVAAAFAGIEAASGPAAKAAIFRDLIARSDPATVKGIIKVLSGDLRIGLREGLVEAAWRRPSSGRSTTSSGPGCSPATSAGSPSWLATARSRPRS
jgi:DNA ligase-1